MSKSPDVYLKHILDEINYLLSLNKVESGSELRADATLSRAVVRSLEIIGEAASKLESDFRSKHDDIPWRKIIDFRNRLIHDYMGINYNIVLNVLEKEIPPLKEVIENLLLKIQAD